MSAPEPTPFVYIGPKGFYVAGVRINDGGTTDDEIALTTIAAAVQRERQAAAASALREAANALAAMSESESFDLCGSEPRWLRERAERAEKGEA